MYGYVTPTGGFTVECWFNRSAQQTYANALFGQQTQNQGANWSTVIGLNGRQFLVYLMATTGALRVDIRSEAGASLLLWTDDGDPASYGADSAWHFVALRVATDKKTVTCWLDNEKKFTTVMATAIDWKPGAMSFGAQYGPQVGNWGDYYLNGGLAYCAVWNSALTDARVTEHFTAGSGGAVFYGDDEVTRLKRIYGFAGVPVSAQRFDPNVTTLQGLTVAGVDPLAAAQGTASDAGGIVFADGQSTMIYHNRRHRYNRPVRVVLSESLGAAPNVGMEFSTDDTKVYNDIRASRPSGGNARLRNLASEYEYGQRVREVKVAVTTDTEMRNAGSWASERYGEDRVRISGVTLSAESSTLIQEIAETIQIGDCIAFDELPDNAPQTYMEFIVERIELSADFKEHTWKLGLSLSPAELWIVFEVGASTLGDGSRVGY